MNTNPYFLSKGNHETPDEGRCAMEWTAWVAGEPHTDQPVCVSPVLKAFCISFNDSLDDETRQRLRPYLARCIGTAGDGRDEERAWMAADWLIRTFTPAWLDLAGLHDHASNLRSLGAVISTETCKAAQPTLDAARAAARAAAWAAAWDAAGAAARAALQPTVKTLQDSAFDLLDRMLPKEWVELPEPVKARAEEVCAA